MRRFLAAITGLTCILVTTPILLAQTCCPIPANSNCGSYAVPATYTPVCQPLPKYSCVPSTPCNVARCSPMQSPRVSRRGCCSPCQNQTCNTQPAITMNNTCCQPLCSKCGVSCQIPTRTCVPPNCTQVIGVPVAPSVPLASPTPPKPCDCGSKLSKQEREELQKTYAINPKMSPKQIRQRCEDYCRTAFPNQPCKQECLDNCPLLIDTCDCVYIPGPFGEIPYCEVTFKNGQPAD